MTKKLMVVTETTKIGNNWDVALPINTASAVFAMMQPSFCTISAPGISRCPRRPLVYRSCLRQVMPSLWPPPQSLSNLLSLLLELRVWSPDELGDRDVGRNRLDSHIMQRAIKVQVSSSLSSNEQMRCRRKQPPDHTNKVLNLVTNALG